MLLVFKTFFLIAIVLIVTPIVYFSLVKYVGHFFCVTPHQDSLYTKLFKKF